LKQFAKDIGAPGVLVCDPHPAQTKREVREFCTQIGTTLKVLEAETQWANHAELYIGLIKEAVCKDMRMTSSPLVIWDYCMEHRALIFQITAKMLFQHNGVNPHTITFGANMDGMDGFIFVMSKHLSLTRRNALDDASALLRIKGMQWLNGF
jgi:hypothetical protein